MSSRAISARITITITAIIIIIRLLYVKSKYDGGGENQVQPPQQLSVKESYSSLFAISIHLPSLQQSVCGGYIVANNIGIHLRR
jgi:hypothetical protein